MLRPHGAVGWLTACDCGIFWQKSLTFRPFIDEILESVKPRNYQFCNILHATSLDKLSEANKGSLLL